MRTENRVNADHLTNEHFLALIITLTGKEKRKNTDAIYNIGRNGTYVQHPDK